MALVVRHVDVRATGRHAIDPGGRQLHVQQLDDAASKPPRTFVDGCAFEATTYDVEQCRCTDPCHRAQHAHASNEPARGECHAASYISGLSALRIYGLDALDHVCDLGHVLFLGRCACWRSSPLAGYCCARPERMETRKLRP